MFSRLSQIEEINLINMEEKDIFSESWAYYTSITILFLTMPACLAFHGGLILFGFSDHGRQRGLIPRLNSWLSMTMIPTIGLLTTFKMTRVINEEPSEYCSELNLMAFFFLFLVLCTVNQILFA